MEHQDNRYFYDGMMETSSHEFIQMVVEDLDGQFIEDDNQIISMSNQTIGNRSMLNHSRGLSKSSRDYPHNSILEEEDDTEAKESEEDDEESAGTYEEGQDLSDDVVVTTRSQRRLLLPEGTRMVVQSNQTDQPGYIAMKPGLQGQSVGLSDIVYGHNTMGHIILQESVDNEMIVEENVEVRDAQSSTEPSHGEIILVPNTMLKQELMEGGEVIVGSNVHPQNVGNEIVIGEHLASNHGSRFEMSLSEIDDDGFDSNLIIDTSVKDEVPSIGYDCAECGAVMRSRGALKKHICKYHASNEPEPFEMPNRIYSCPSCTYQTQRRDKLDRHMAKHVADGYSPSGKKRTKLTPPQRMRHAAEEYKCPLCPYKCTVEKAFKKHMKLHQAGTKHFVVKVSCKICGKDRSSEADVRKHMKKHKDGKDFVCDICGFASIQMKKIIQHRRMHTGEKPHLCPHCSYRSARRDNLRSHVRRMHKKENMYIDTFNPRHGEVSVQD